MKRLLAIVLAACASQSAMPDAGDGGTGMDARPNACGSASLSGIQLATIPTENPLDPLGFPPYAIDGCALVWVASDGSLMLRDFGRGGVDVVIANASENARRPTTAGGIVAWESNGTVRWRDRAGNVSTIPGAFASAGEPRAAKNAIAFTAWMTADPKGDTDVLVFSTDTKTVATIGAGPAQQRFADIDDTRVAFADFSEGGPTGAFDDTMLADGGYAPADIVVVDRTSMAKTTRGAPGKQAFPMLVTGDAVAYLDWSQVRPMPKLFAYGLKVGPALGMASADVDVPPTGTIETNHPYIRPSVHGGLFQWIAGDVLWQRPADLSSGPTMVETLPNGLATVMGDAMTLVAVGSFGNVTLLSIAH